MDDGWVRSRAQGGRVRAHLPGEGSPSSPPANVVLGAVGEGLRWPKIRTLARRGRVRSASTWRRAAHADGRRRQARCPWSMASSMSSFSPPFPLLFHSGWGSLSNLNAHVTSNMLGGMKASDRTITGIQSRSSEPQTRSSGARNREKGGGEETALPPSWTPPGGASPMPQKERDSIFGGSFEIKTTETRVSATCMCELARPKPKAANEPTSKL